MEAIKLFDGFVESASLSVGYGADNSSCQISLVYEGDGPKRTQDFEDNFPKLGTVVGFKVGACEFAGIFQRFTHKRSLDGYRYDVILESPAKLLDGIQIILDGFQGTPFSGLNPTNPGADPTFDHQLNNIWNPFAVRENYDYGGLYGSSNVNSAGFPGLDALRLIEEISQGMYAFGGPAVFGESTFEVDLSELIAVIGSMNNPGAFRIKGSVSSLNAIIQEACDLICYDYIVTIKPKSGPIVNGPLGACVIKIKMIDKTFPPDPGTVKNIVTQYERDEKLISADTGKELSDAVTQKLVIGGPATRYYQTGLGLQIWGKTRDLLPQYVDYVILEDGTPYPIADPFEVRCAMGSFDTWILYHLIKKYKNQLNPIVGRVGATLFSRVRLDNYTIQKIVQGDYKINDLIDTTSKVWDERAKLFNGLTIREYLGKIHSSIESAGREYYGRKFLVPLPVEPGGLANNIKFITEDQEYISSWEIADAAFSPFAGFSDVSFYDSEGKLKATAEWGFDPVNGDYSGMGDSYALSMTGIAGLINVEKDIYWAGFSGFFAPCAVVELPEVNLYDGYTTDENGLYWLLNRELNIPLTALQILAGIGSDGVTLNFPIAPDRGRPLLFSIPQQSSRYSWGPWWDWNALNGKAEVIVETSLTPETYGGFAGCNEVGYAYARVMNAEIAGVESGMVELAELPFGNIGDRFAVSGPYVTGMDINIDIGGIKTGYKFNTWTPQYGKLAKYNADRIARINKATIRFLQDQRNLLTKGTFDKPKVDKPIRKLRPLPNMGFMAGLFGIFKKQPVGNNQKAKKLNISGQHPNNVMGPVSQDYDASYGCTNEQLMSPIAVGKSLSTTQSNTKPSMTAASAGKGGRFDRDHTGPTSKELNPYFYHSDTDFQIAVYNSGKPTSLDLQENKSKLTEIRTMGFRGPMLLSGWGYDLDSTPVPAKGTSGADRYAFIDDAATDRSLWKSGPLDVKWDSERKVWSTGPDIVVGILTSNITAPSSPSSPTTYTVSIYRTKDWDNTKAESITCTNRDPSLSVTNKSGKIFVGLIRVNYEWYAFWVGCPELIK